MRTPGEVIERWTRAWNDGDADAIAALFAPDAEFVNVVGLWWHNRESIRTSHAFGFEKIFRGSTIRMNPPRVRYVGEDAAIVHSRWNISGQISPGGEPAGRREGIFVFVLERQSLKWIVVTAQNTDVVRGAQTHITGPDSHTPIYYERPT